MKQRILQFFSASLILTGFLACNKDGESYETLTRLANLKIEEAVSLTQGHTCGTLDEWRIDTLSYAYVPVHPSFEDAYKKLIAEANELHRKADKLRGNYPNYDVLRASLPPHFGIRCIENEVKVAAATDLSVNEIDSRLDQLLPELTIFFDDVPCNDAKLWNVATIRKDCDFIDILITNTDNFYVFGQILKTYTHLHAAKRHLNNSPECPTVNENPAKGVTCENGKPKISY